VPEGHDLLAFFGKNSSGGMVELDSVNKPWIFKIKAKGKNKTPVFAGFCFE
jgi:hypothetical protein